MVDGSMFQENETCLYDRREHFSDKEQDRWDRTIVTALPHQKTSPAVSRRTQYFLSPLFHPHSETPKMARLGKKSKIPGEAMPQFAACARFLPSHAPSRPTQGRALHLLDESQGLSRPVPVRSQ